MDLNLHLIHLTFPETSSEIVSLHSCQEGEHREKTEVCCTNIWKLISNVFIFQHHTDPKHTAIAEKSHFDQKWSQGSQHPKKSVTNHGRPDDISMLLSILYFITYYTVAVLTLPGCSFPAASHMYITTITTWRGVIVDAVQVRWTHLHSITGHAPLQRALNILQEAGRTISEDYLEKSCLREFRLF